ncbi:PIN domain-containing protein [Streptomyces sp. NPDC001876]|uniref:PIN domain-containing protein n=1 Tax=Streptomyces sp. NPDC001876 TaxID=3154402 RepID=UPI003323D8C2
MTSSFLAAFDGLWRRPASDYEVGVRSYTVAVDTNVLLELYRFTPDAREELLQALRRVGDRLWIPHQVAVEYYSRRVDAVKDHLALYTSVPKSLEEHRAKVLQELYTFAKRCSMSAEDKSALVDPVNEAFTQVKAEVDKHAESFDLTLERVISGDPVLSELAEILDGRTGQCFNTDETDTLIQEYEKRAKDERPPGYKDSNKKENAHGDYFVWEQVLRRAEELSSPILLVTNDVKEDWVRKEAGLIVGARPELVEEMKERCGVDFLILQLGGFLQVARKELGASVSASTVAQAENLAASIDRPLVLQEAEYEDLIFHLVAHRDQALSDLDRARDSLEIHPGDETFQADREFAEADVARTRKLISQLKRNSQRKMLNGKFAYWVDEQLVRRAKKVALEGGARSFKSRRLLRAAETGEIARGGQGLKNGVETLRSLYEDARSEEATWLQLLEQPDGLNRSDFDETEIRQNLQRARDEGQALELRLKRLRNSGHHNE